MPRTRPIFEGPGQIRALLSVTDWQSSPLGPPETWDGALVTAVELMLDSSIPIRVCCGPDLLMLYNDAYIELLGRRHPEGLGQPYFTVWPEIAPATRALVAQVMAGEPVFVDELELTLHRHGRLERTWFSYAFAPVRNEAREVIAMFGACIELTRQKQLEARLAEEGRRMQQLFQQAPGFMAVMRGPAHVFEFANAAMHRLLGGRDLIGLPVRQAVPELEGQGYFELFDTVFRTGETYVAAGRPALLRQAPDAEPVERFLNFVYQPIVEADGAVSGIFVEGADITGQHLAQAALRGVNLELQDKLASLERAERRLAFQVELADLLRGLNDPCDVYARTSNLIGRFLGASRVFCAEPAHETGTLSLHANFVADGMAALTGTHTAAELGLRDVAALAQGRAWVSADVRHDPLAADPALRAAFERCAVRAACVVPLHRGEGAPALLCVQQNAPRAWTGDEVRLLEDAADRTWGAVERARAEQALRQADRRKDEFLAMLAHELRNPLAPIVAAAELIGAGTLDGEQLRRTGVIVQRQARHMTELIDDLLDVSRVTRGLVAIDQAAQEIKDIVAVAVEQARPLVAARRHQLSVALPDEPAPVLGDQKRLIQVLINLLNNAAKYTPEGGRIDLAVGVADKTVTVTVRDNGIGIPRAMQSRIFDLFAQAERTPDRSQGGLGVGLALVRSLVELHGGTVSCDSAGQGAGSAFTVALPRLRDARQASRADRPAPGAAWTC